MTGLEIYKFIQKNDLNIEWDSNTLMLWIDHDLIAEFVKIVQDIFDDGGIEVWLKSDHILIDLVPLCEKLDINPEDILSR